MRFLWACMSATVSTARSFTERRAKHAVRKRSRDTIRVAPDPLRTKVLCPRFSTNWHSLASIAVIASGVAPRSRDQPQLRGSANGKLRAPKRILKAGRRSGARSLPTSFKDPNLSLGSAAISIWRTSGRLTLPTSQSEQADRRIAADARTLGRDRRAKRGF